MERFLNYLQIKLYGFKPTLDASVKAIGAIHPVAAIFPAPIADSTKAEKKIMKGIS